MSVTGSYKNTGSFSIAVTWGDIVRARAGLLCANMECAAPLDAREPVRWGVPRRQWPLVIWEGGVHIRRDGRGLLCASCAPGDRWCAPRPCQACSRPILYPVRMATDRRHGLPKRALCSDRCSWYFYNRQRSERLAEARLLDCAVCGERFQPSRADALTCSPACRQKAYRRRRVR